MLSYKSRSGLSWHANLRAARLVPDTGVAQLPPPIGNVLFHEIADPHKFGLPMSHPLQEKYPNLKVIDYFMVIEKRFLVERNGIRGIALYTDSNGSDLCLSITSENGRNPLAPWDWEGMPGSQTDPAAQGHLEWRSIEINGVTYPWFNAAIHGWNGQDRRDGGLDWRDGIPESVITMYDRNKGRVGQSIMVPYEAAGLGAAEQTMDPDEVNKTYSVLLFFPKEDKLTQMRNHQQPQRRSSPTIPQYDTLGSALESYGALPKKSRSITSSVKPNTSHLQWASPVDDEITVSLAPERSGQESIVTPVQSDYKMGVGGWIRQHIITNPFGQEYWNETPEVLLVCWPISEERANSLLSTKLGGTRLTF